MRLIIEVDLTIQSQRDVGSVTGDVGVASRIRVAFRLASRFDAIKKITDVESRGVATDFVDFPALQQGR